MQETESLGLEDLKARQWDLGTRVRALMVASGFPSVAATGFQAPGVVVSYTDDLLIHNGKKFIEQGLQTAAGVPLMCDEPADFRTFRIGLFGLDKWLNPEQTVNNLERALSATRSGN
jgi:aspartate aminotransferase-like enzyme